MATWRDKCGCMMQCMQQLCVADNMLITLRDGALVAEHKQVR